MKNTPEWDGWGAAQAEDPIDTTPQGGLYALPILIVLAPILAGLGYALACWAGH